MLLTLLISLAFGQTGEEGKTMPEIPNTSQEWCEENAKIKDKFVRMPDADCTWTMAAPNSYMPSIPDRVYICTKYVDGKLPGSIGAGYEGSLRCKNPAAAGKVYASVAEYDFVYLCAVCATADTTSGKVDKSCADSMFYTEMKYCRTDKAAEMEYLHTETGLKQKIGGKPVPPFFPYN